MNKDKTKKIDKEESYHETLSLNAQVSKAIATMKKMKLEKIKLEELKKQNNQKEKDKK